MFSMRLHSVARGIQNPGLGFGGKGGDMVDRFSRPFLKREVPLDALSRDQIYKSRSSAS